MNYSAKTILTLLLFAFLSTNTFSQMPQYYNTMSGTSGNSFPFGVLAGMHVQWLIRANDFSQPSPAPEGSITKIYILMAYNATTTFNNLTIKMGQATINTLPEEEYYTGPMATVYSRTSVVLSSSSNSWLALTLDNPFSYDPAKALIIDILQCGANNGNTSVRMSNATPFTRNNSTATGCTAAHTNADNQYINFGIDLAASICPYGWIPQSSGVTSNLNTVKAVSNTIGWAAGNGGVVLKCNSGISWVNANPNPGVINGDVYAIEAIDANTAWVSTSPGAAYIYKTVNGGTNWTQVFTQPGGFINDIKFINANTGYIYGDPVGGRWTIFRTTNGGTTWDSSGMYLQQTGSETGWNNSMFILGNNLWFGTNNTRVYHSTNLGVGGWSFGITTGTVNSYAVHFIDNAVGYTSGSVLLKTQNGGETWLQAGIVPGTGNMNAIEANYNRVWITRGTDIFQSTNGGTSFILSTTGSAVFNDMDFAIVNGCSVGWAVGNSGQIKRLDVLTGVVNNESGLPSDYVLAQNYPNPFNPSTEIGYSIPEAGNVKLIIYDVQGRVIRELVNEFKTPGSYKIIFDASAMASGVYLYELGSGKFSQTKKMVLLK